MGRVIEQHTRAFNAESGVTNELRKKENEDDYGYIFDPDLAKVSLGKDYVQKILRVCLNFQEKRREVKDTIWFLGF